MSGFTVIEDLLNHQPVPDEGILTRQIHDDSTMRVVLLTFSPGQKLSEHTASRPTLLHFLAGEATVTLGPEVIDVHPGSWVRMDAGLPHSVVTKSAVTMLLVLCKEAKT